MSVGLIDRQGIGDLDLVLRENPIYSICSLM